jgi:hypothetical protein
MSRKNGYASPVMPQCSQIRSWPEIWGRSATALSRNETFVADLTSIVSAAHELPAEVDPPARVWASLHAQLEREGILGLT